MCSVESCSRRGELRSKTVAGLMSSVYVLHCPHALIMGISQGSFGVFLPVLMKSLIQAEDKQASDKRPHCDFKLMIQTTSVVEPRLELGLRETNFREQIISGMRRSAESRCIVHATPFY
ncbi:hypothetical protein OS493_021675 [Desmophyllum pertusum]|uniref:Uncharacterized protein n=1 Tax=Desmophyllum pertusum TaxID=174260 RepID=A0A9W9YBD4_9CNID|nr:hypothetical protein OS493_021675 [Desmophyllum pertusum]